MLLAILLGKLSRWFIRLFRPGGGSSVPGKIALIVYPGLIEKLRSRVGLGVVAVSGSAGKSTTTKLIVSILRAHGLRVFTNESTANIAQGLASSLVKNASLTGHLDIDVWVLELDEGHAAKLAQTIQPDVCVLTNLMVDQLDRFDDPEEVLVKLRDLAAHSKLLVFNADDPYLGGIRHNAVRGFAAGRELLAAADAPELAPYFGSKPVTLAPALTVSRTNGGDLRVTQSGLEYSLRPQVTGSHNFINIAAAWLAAAEFLGQNAVFESFVEAIENTPPVFARDELVKVGDSSIRLVLVQNPGSFRLNLKRIGAVAEPLMIAIGSDVHDPSWIWSIDLSQFNEVNIAAGSNAHQLALWLSYQGIVVGEIEPDLPAATDRFLALLDGSQGTIILTADAMRRLRRHLGLAK